MSGALKPNHKSIQHYYSALPEYGSQHVEHEGALETAFSRMLADTARGHGWTLIPKLAMKAKGKSSTIISNGTLRNGHELRRGYCEAKDTSDKLDDEIRKKIAKD